jgi:hypothetical protein
MKGDMRMDTRLVPQDIYLQHEEEWRMIRTAEDSGKDERRGSAAWKGIKAKPKASPSLGQERSIRN